MTGRRDSRDGHLVAGAFATVAWVLRLRPGESRHGRKPLGGGDWRRIGRGALVAGVLGSVACALGAVFDLRATLAAWLFASIVWIGMPLGALAMLMCHNLTAGGWGEISRPALKAMIATLPLFALAFVPLLVLMPHIFAWVAPAAALPDVVRRKAYWLNQPFFWARCTVFFAVWTALAWRLNVWRTEPPEARPFGASGGGMVAWGVTLTFFAFDWLLSLQPRFYSDVFGMLYMSDVIVVALATVLLVLAFANPVRDELLVARMQDIGNLLLAALCGWIFINFVQYLIIWNGNLPDEIAWYLPRSRHGWQWLTRVLFVIYFAVPFAALLSRRVKRSRAALAWIAGITLFGHALNAYWLVMPSLYQHAYYIDWRPFAAFFGVGGLWGALFAFGYARRHAEAEAAVEGAMVRG